ncbi:hypothetical protein QAD02_019669 [Eretmocerus hayati]|uniref:Uncharacterized protein n=1 Tax=Eretmocerus hayati TaxID=131215 RepID=A0ACC2PNG7_9HYME|nr:hypothetical protein QAD02_019669 [Eretmocerus hayati]
MNEAVILCKLHHTNVVSFLGVTQYKGQINVVMEFISGINLEKVLFDPILKIYLSPDLESHISEDITRAIVYLHHPSIPIIHCDIKPSNIIVDTKTMTAKLCDFGSACTSESLVIENKCLGEEAFLRRGTLLYRAPEVQLYEKPNSVALDVWALSATIVTIFSEALVWPVKDVNNCEKEITEKMLFQETPQTSTLPNFLITPIKRCFSYIIEQRPTAEQLLLIFLNHSSNL